MENTGSDQFNRLYLIIITQVMRFVVTVALYCACVFTGLSTNLGTVLHRKITMRHLTCSGLFK